MSYPHLDGDDIKAIGLAAILGKDNPIEKKGAQEFYAEIVEAIKRDPDMAWDIPKIDT